jgi:two-component system CheB/CheR fusion protein
MSPHEISHDGSESSLAAAGSDEASLSRSDVGHVGDEGAPSRAEPLAAGPSYIVALGASAGGLEALHKFFQAMPAESGMAFVVIQHLSPDHRSLMDELLERVNTMPVIQVRGSTPVRTNHVYLLCPGCELTIADNELHSRERPKDGSQFLPINVFFRSLAEAWRERAVAIVLSGNGSDGTHGALDIRDHGGMVLAQSPESAPWPSMPQSVINTGCADAVLPPEEMPHALLSCLAAPAVEKPPGQPTHGPGPTGGVASILGLLRDRYHIDFNRYKPSTIVRRIERRMALNSLSLEEYVAKLRGDALALDALYKDLLIGVTRFFRDEDAFGVLKQQIIPKLLALVPPEDELRVWVCGCATGEEAYSIAIELLEAFEAAGREPLLKILATDLHSESLQTAGAGVYSEDSLQELPADLRAKYFEPVNPGRFKAIPSLRRTLVFSQHNVIHDPPFTKIHLVSCRNLLIYLQPLAQTRAIACFHYSLVQGGILFLGASESLGSLGAEFETLDRAWKFFRKTSESRLSLGARTLGTELLRAAPSSAQPTVPMLRVYDALMEAFVPTGLLLNGQQQVLHIYGEAKRFIRAESGRVSNDISSMVCKDLQLPLTSAMRNAGRQQSTVVLPNVRVQHDSGREERLKLTVIPIAPKANPPVYMATMEPEVAPATVEKSRPTHSFDVGDEVKDYISELESDLQRTRESLQATVEELETSNEELQASNEELLSSNEELQSTNEELQSVNEELYSINAEHEMKIEELDRIGNDLRNLIQSTDTATIFVDGEFRVRLFTPKATEVIYLLPQDIGRDIRHINTAVPDPHLGQDIAAIYASGQAVARALEDADGRSFLRRCTTYQDVSGQSKGVVVNYVETTQLIRSNRALAESESRFGLILETIPSAIFVVDDDMRIAVTNPAAQRLFGSEGRSMLGTELVRWLPELADASQLQAPHTAGAPAVLTSSAVCLDGAHIPVELTWGSLTLAQRPCRVLVVTDIRGRIASERAQAEALEAAKNLARARSQFLANMSHEIRTPLNGILGFAQVGLAAATTNVEEPPWSHFSQILASGEHLLEIINEVLEFARIDAGTQELQLQPVELPALIREAMTEVAFMVKGRPVALRFDQEGQSIEPVVTDPQRVRQALVNLLSNALKFTAQGEVVVELAVQDAEVTIAVRDSGIGIEAKDLQRIFEPFEQADASTTRRYGGTGLGLAITRRQIELLGGRVTVSSTVGSGSTFTLHLPWQAAAVSPPAPPPAPTAAPDVRGLKVLVAEDDATNQALMRNVLDSLGVSFTLFDNGQQLVDHVRNLGASPADLVLMDLQMPAMSGYDAARELLRIDPSLPIVAMTAHAFAEDQEEIVRAGMVGRVTKPFRIRDLASAIDRFARRPAGQTA